MTKAKLPSYDVQHWHTKFGQYVVLRVSKGDPLEVPWEKLAYPWDNSFYALSELAIPLPQEQPESLPAKLQILGGSAVQTWAAFHWVLRDGPTDGTHKLPPCRGLVQASKLEGEELLALLRLCENLIGWAPRHELPYMTASHWWTSCVQDRWLCSVQRVLTGDLAPAKRYLRDSLYLLAKRLQSRDVQPDKPTIPEGLFPAPAPHWRLLLDLAVQRSAIDHRFEKDLFIPYCDAFRKEAQSWTKPQTVLSFVDSKGDLFIGGSKIKRSDFPAVDKFEALVQDAYPAAKS